jgi:energy-coupling factor transporter ATP-binding protein EcfA2
MEHEKPPRTKVGQRIAVIGTTGSGKTTLARQLAQRLSTSHVELDALYWDPDWTPAPLDLFRERVVQSLNGSSWIVDGNYSKVRDLVWQQADTVVWLDFSARVIFRRLARRTVRRLINHEELWNGNREDWQRTFLSRGSLFLWALKKYRYYPKTFPVLFARPEFAHLTIVRLRSPRATHEWFLML